MLTVWSVLWGTKYPRHYVYRLRNMVRRHLLQPHRFLCLTDRQIPGIDCVPTTCAYQGWWQKLALFEPGRAADRNLYLDLDSVIVGSLDTLAMRHADDDLAMAKNWAQSGHDSCQSSVMFWRGGAYPEIWSAFDFARDSPRLWGDQEWITELLGRPGEGKVAVIEHPAVVSYKYHCTGGPPAGAVVVTFHGTPKPHEVIDPWIRTNWW